MYDNTQSCSHIVGKHLWWFSVTLCHEDLKCLFDCIVNRFHKEDSLSYLYDYQEFQHKQALCIVDYIIHIVCFYENVIYVDFHHSVDE